MNVDNYLLTGIEMFEEDAQGRYEKSEDAKAAWAIGEHVAKLLHQDVETLSTTSREGIWADLREAFASADLMEDIELAVQARLAYHMMPSYEQAARRCWALSELVRRVDPAPASKAFLIRVARCYLLDFVPECLVMCRGALENAVNARYAREDEPPALGPKPTMRMKLNLAENAGWLPSARADALFGEVWLRGSKAAHGDPNAVGNALGAIRLTMAALGDLCPSVADDEAA
jgi:hypothetical protein